MKYKCLKCGCEFEAKWHVLCPDCGASSTLDVVPIYKYKLSHPEIPVEVPATVEK